MLKHLVGRTGLGVLWVLMPLASAHASDAHDTHGAHDTHAAPAAHDAHDAHAPAKAPAKTKKKAKAGHDTAAKDPHDGHGDGDAHASPESAPPAKAAKPASKPPASAVEADGTFTIRLDPDGDSPEHDGHAAPASAAAPSPGHAPPAPAHAPDAPHDAHGTPAPAASPHGAPEPTRVRRPARPRDWKPLTGTGVAPGRRNKWGVVETLPPHVAARLRIGYRGDEVEFPNRVLFKHDSIAFDPGADPVLREIAALLQASPEIEKLWIEGHTDITGSERYNQKLSEARASAVREALVRLGVAPERLVAYGFGETRPIAPPDKGKKRLENRRVVFRMVSADRPALVQRKPKEFARAAVVGVRGGVQWRLNPLGATTSQAPRRLPAGALAEGAEAPPDDEPVFAAEGEAQAAAEAEAAAVLHDAHEASPATDTDDESSPAAEAEAELANAPSVAAAGSPQGWEPLVFKAQLAEGAEVDTGAAGKVLLRLPDLSRVQLDAGTLLQLTKLFFSTADNKSYTGMRVERGHTRMSINPDRRGTAKAIIAWSGGSVEVNSADLELDLPTSGNGYLAVTRGDVRVSTGGAASVTLTTGQWLVLARGEGPKLLPVAPIPIGPLRDSVPEPLLAWTAVNGASGYRVEVAEDVTFHQVIHVVDVAANVDRARTPDVLEDQPWYWRVTARTAEGVSGMPSKIHAFRIDRRAPALVIPGAAAAAP
jgi:outer membrane protein OmpA-like peptidoglycan-associated protein